MRRFLAVGLAAVLLLTLSGTAFAAKGGNKGGNTGAGPVAACAVNPNPVVVGGDWTVAGTGLPANTYVNVWESDAYSTTIWFAQTDGSGSLSITWHSYNAGTSTISFTTALTNHSTTLATCTFVVN